MNEFGHIIWIPPAHQICPLERAKTFLSTTTNAIIHVNRVLSLFNHEFQLSHKGVSGVSGVSMPMNEAIENSKAGYYGGSARSERCKRATKWAGKNAVICDWKRVLIPPLPSRPTILEIGIYTPSTKDISVFNKHQLDF